MKTRILLLAAVFGTLASAAAQTAISTNTPAQPPAAQVRPAGPSAAARLEMISRVTEETLGSDFDADAILAAWKQNVAKLAKEAGAIENETAVKKSGPPIPPPARPALSPIFPAGPVSAQTAGSAAGRESSAAVPKTPSTAAAFAKDASVAWIDETRAALQKALDRLDTIRAALSTH